VRPKNSDADNLKRCNEREVNADQQQTLHTTPLSGDADGRKEEAQTARGSSGN